MNGVYEFEWKWTRPAYMNYKSLDISFFFLEKNNNLIMKNHTAFTDIIKIQQTQNHLAVESLNN